MKYPTELRQFFSYNRINARVLQPDGIEQPARIFRYARRWIAKARFARCSLERKRSEHIYIVKLRKLIAVAKRAAGGNYGVVQLYAA